MKPKRTVKYWVRFGIVITGSLVIICGALASLDPYKSAIKEKASSVVNTIEKWNRPEDKFFVEQEIVLNEPFIATTEKNIYKHDEQIRLLLYGSGHVDLYVEHYDVNGSLTHTENRGLEFEGVPPVSYSSIKGVKGIPVQYRITPKNENGWVDIEVSPSLGRKINIPVFIESSNGSNVLFVESTDTLNAYKSAYGLPTHYKRNVAPLGAYTRPLANPQNYNILDYSHSEMIDCADHLINADLVHKKFLNTLGVDLKAVSDNYLDSFENIQNAKLLIFGAHNEYWTTRKAVNVIRFVGKGGSVLFLGGNTAWRIVERTKDFDLMRGDNLLDDGFEELINQVLGSYYDMNGYKTSAPFEVDSKADDILKMLFFNNNKYARRFGIGTDFDSCSALVIGASGQETDKLISTASDDFKILARGRNSWWKGGAEIVYREFTSGGAVLNFGSVSLWHKLSDENIKMMLSSFISRSLMEASASSEGGHS